MIKNFSTSSDAPRLPGMNDHFGEPGCLMANSFCCLEGFVVMIVGCIPLVGESVGSVTVTAGLMGSLVWEFFGFTTWFEELTSGGTGFTEEAITVGKALLWECTFGKTLPSMT